MKVKNVSDSFLFPVGNLVGDDAKTVVRKDGESDEDYGKRSNELRAKMAESSAIRAQNVKSVADGKPLMEESMPLADLQAQLDPDRLAKYKSLGVELPSDLIKVTMTLGSLVFDLFQVTMKPPTAPLAAALFSRRVQSLAARLQKDEFELADDLLDQVRPALEDEKLWATTNLTIYTLVKGQKNYLQVNNNAAGFFPNVVTSAINVFLPEVTDTASEEVAAEPAPATTADPQPVQAVENAPETPSATPTT